MGIEEIHKALEMAMSDTAEHLFFQELMEVRIQQPEESLLPGDYLVTIQISDPFKGSLGFIYEQRFASQLVTEMLGDFVKDEQQVIDGLKEVSNTIAGKLMANYIPEKQFKISLPQCSKISEISDVPSDKIYNYYFDETKIGVDVQLE